MICVDLIPDCPIEDCGIIVGYAHFLEIIMDPKHKEYEEMPGRVCGNFGPEHLNVHEIYFDDPDDRLKYAFS
jgi:Plasmid pRiA4b ORF-3-like protein